MHEDIKLSTFQNGGIKIGINTSFSFKWTSLVIVNILLISALLLINVHDDHV